MALALAGAFLWLAGFCPERLGLAREAWLPLVLSKGHGQRRQGQPGLPLLALGRSRSARVAQGRNTRVRGRDQCPAN